MAFSYFFYFEPRNSEHCIVQCGEQAVEPNGYAPIKQKNIMKAILNISQNLLVLMTNYFSRQHADFNIRIVDQALINRPLMHFQFSNRGLFVTKKVIQENEPYAQSRHRLAGQTHFAWPASINSNLQQALHTLSLKNKLDSIKRILLRTNHEHLILHCHANTTYSIHMVPLPSR